MELEDEVTSSITLGKEPMLSSQCTIGNPLVRPIYDEFLVKLKEKGWSDEEGKPTILDLHVEGIIDYNEDLGLYYFTLRATRGHERFSN